MENPSRQKSVIDGASALISERRVAYEARDTLQTTVERLGAPEFENPQTEELLGLFRPEDSRRAVLADMDYIETFISAGKGVPGFPEAGPRRRLFFNPRTVRAAIVTSGGVAPGLNRVTHAIVQRHYATYGCDITEGGAVFGVYDGITGLLGDEMDIGLLSPEFTREHLAEGGSKLGLRRVDKDVFVDQTSKIIENLRKQRINILYVIGGDGSLRAANHISKLVPDMAVIGVPKTMDNDILWVAQSFGFSNTVDKATDIIRQMQTEATSTRRVGIVELFGAESGFVAANAAHALGKATLELIPEMFVGYQTATEIEDALMLCLEHVVAKVAAMPRGEGVIVVAEGVGELMWQRKVKIGDEEPIQDRFSYQVERWLRKRLKDGRGRSVGTFVNRPRHHIRAIPPNAFDQTYCDRLGALAVEAGLAGYTRCVISYWLSEFVLVPLPLIAQGQKRLTTSGMFWKQIVLSTGQPAFGVGT